MTSYVENETQVSFPFAVKETADLVIQKVLETENGPDRVQVSILLTDNEKIRQYNREFRGIDRETDVLSFPNVDFEVPADFSAAGCSKADYYDPETGELILGDIILSVDKVQEQAMSYGHSIRREFAFLVAHSMLHLCGYDHMDSEEAAIMEEKQEQVLTALQITRERA